MWRLTSWSLQELENFWISPCLCHRRMLENGLSASFDICSENSHGGIVQELRLNHPPSMGTRWAQDQQIREMKVVCPSAESPETVYRPRLRRPDLARSKSPSHLDWKALGPCGDFPEARSGNRFESSSLPYAMREDMRVCPFGGQSVHR